MLFSVPPVETAPLSHSAPQPKRRPTASLGTLVWVFYSFLFLLTSSGRLNNWDPLAQLQAATALVTSGSLGVSENPMPAVGDLWVLSRNGYHYEAHDLGGSLLLTPAALVGVAVEGQGKAATALVQEPPWSARVLGTLTYALLGACGCYAIFRLFAIFYPPRTAWLLSIVFAGTTTYWAYTRIAYDILGGCVGVCFLLWFCSDALNRSSGKWHDAVRIAFATAFACVFRFSLTPFLLLGVAAVLLLLWRRWGGRWPLTAGAILLVGLAPNLYFNFLRTGMPVKNAATGNAPVVAALHGTLRDGLYGLILSPNWGLLWFAPVFLLLALVPWVWRRSPLPLRQTFLCFLPGALAYVAVIAKLNHWTGYSGWGPRYLLPIVPILFVGVALVLTTAWNRHRRLLTVVVALSALLNLPSLLVNFRAAQSAYPGASEISASSPRQQIAAWKALGEGLSGKATPVLADASRDPIRRHAGDFPDLWTVRLMTLGLPFQLLGLLITAVLLAGVGLSVQRILAFLRDSEKKQSQSSKVENELYN